MPGDDVVDWVAWDPYNWVDCHGRDGDWIEFADKVRTFYRWLRVHGHADKPFMLGEYGSDEPLAGQPTAGVVPARPQRSEWCEQQGTPAVPEP